MWRFIFSLILIGYTTSLVAQDRPQLPKEKVSFKPHDIKVGLNAIRTGRTMFGTDIQTYEVQGILALHQFNLVADLGSEKNTRGESFGYESSGNYFRIGTDWNFVKDRPSGNILSLGLRYARAYFKDELVFSGDQGFGEQTFAYANPKLRARWFEVTFNLRGKVVSNLYMGFTMRWQAFRTLRGEETLKAYEIPGFGKTKRQNSTGFDYYIMWRIPFEKVE
ncbi:MAG: hypothetical protein Tsb0034_06620 [Ekhidna sp.]